LHSERGIVYLNPTARRRHRPNRPCISPGLDAEKIVVIGSESFENEVPFRGRDPSHHDVSGLPNDIFPLLLRALDVEVLFILADIVGFFRDLDEAEFGGVIVVRSVFEVLAQGPVESNVECFATIVVRPGVSIRM
jgi:hypothetical protein